MSRNPCATVDVAGHTPSTTGRLVALGVLSLGIGLLIYLTDRPADSAYFLRGDFAAVRISGISFGSLGQWLPAFLHVYAFILFTVVLAGLRGRQVMAACVAWFTIDALFECGQHPAIAPVLASSVPEWFQRVPVLENTASYFARGVFDPTDILFIALGAVSAYATIRFMAMFRSRT
jgi:hypothetical protein